MTYERPMTRGEAVSVLCGLLALGICGALLLACSGCVALGNHKTGDIYPQGWEARCVEMRRSALDWYITRYGKTPVEPPVEVVVMNEPTTKYYGLITYKAPRYYIQVWPDPPSEINNTLNHEFRHALMMRNQNSGTEQGIRRRQ